MTDLETTPKIATMIDFAYERTIERIETIEGAPYDQIYQTTVKENNRTSYLLAYCNYYFGCLEGILFVQFLEEFNRMPTPLENAFIEAAIKQKFENLKDRIADVAKNRCQQDGYW